MAADGETVVVWSPWMPRGADNARFTFEIVYEINAYTFTFDVYQKNSDELVNDGSVAVANASFSSVSVGATVFWSATGTGLEELIRYKITLTGGAGSGIPSGVCYRIHPPTWYNTAG
jgi:hypothetical protein